MRYAIGIDIGGTSVQTGIVSEDGAILHQSVIPTLAKERSADEIAEAIFRQILELRKHERSCPICVLGIGCPGIIDPTEGVLLYASNLPFNHFPLCSHFQEKTGVTTYLCNDADAAALAEVRIGSGRGCQSAVMLTLGTGIGSALIRDGKIYTGFNGQGCEFGHMVIHSGGEPCSCGRKGCMEAYCAAPALRRRTEQAILRAPDSILAERAASEGKVGGRSAFNAADEGCPVAQKLLEEYYEDCAEGLANVINGLFPELIILGGGVSRQGEAFRSEIERRILSKCLCPDGLEKTRVALAALGTEAGMIGAALHALSLERESH